MLDNNIDFRKYIESNIMTSDEAAETLEVTRQHVSLLTRTKKLQPLKKVGGSNIYLRSDIEDYRNSDTTKQITRTIIKDYGNVNTWKLINEWQDKDQLKDVEAAFLYFSDLDAAMDGFYEILPEFCGSLRAVVSPHFVLRFRDGTEYWNNHALPGYEGGGPRIAKVILGKCGFSQSDLSEITSNRIVKLFRDEEGNVNVYSHENGYANPGVRNDVENSTHVRIYAKNNQLVLLQDTYFDQKPDDSLETLKKYMKFLPNPSEVIVMSIEKAMELGFLLHTNFPYMDRQNIYSVIIKDASGRAIWLSPNVPIKNERDILKHGTLKEILFACGYETTNIEESSIKGWLLSLIRRVAAPERELFVFRTEV